MEYDTVVSWNGGAPVIIHFSRILHYKPTIFGIHRLWTSPYMRMSIIWKIWIWWKCYGDVMRIFCVFLDGMEYYVNLSNAIYRRYKTNRFWWMAWIIMGDTMRYNRYVMWVRLQIGIILESSLWTSAFHSRIIHIQSYESYTLSGASLFLIPYLIVAWYPNSVPVDRS